MVVLLSEPLRTQRCAVQAVGGPELACDDRRTWQLPGAEDLAAGGVVGAAVLGGLARPFVRG